LRRLAPWPANFLDPAPAIARRVVELLGEAAAPPSAGATRTIFTSGRAPVAALARFGIGKGIEANEAATTHAR
jgi:glutamate racemase